MKIQQLVIIKTSALNGSAYCLSHNVPLGKKIGLTEEQIAAAQGSDYMASPALDARQKAAIRWAEAVTNMTARNDAPRSQPRPAPIIPIFIWRALLPELLPHHHCGFLEPRLLLASPGFGLSIHGGFGADASRFTKRSLPSPRAKRLHRWML